MPAGRPATPTALKALRGTQRPCRTNLGEPKPPCLDADTLPPSWLNEQGAAVWRETLPGVHLWVTICDAELFARWCGLVADYRHLRADIDLRGMTAQRISATGAPLGSVKRPEVEMIRQVEKELRAIESLIGFTPSTRSRVSAAATNEPEHKISRWFRAGESQ